MALVPVFQASKVLSGTWSGTDYDYPVGIDAARASQQSKYSIDGVAFVAEDSPQTGYNAFARYVSNGFHFFTTNIQGENMNGWSRAPAATTAYLQAIGGTPPTGAVPLLRYWSAGSQSGVAHFFAADTGVTPVPAGFVAEDPTHIHTGWTTKPARVEFQVYYTGSGGASGITIVGGNAVGQTVTIDGTDYVLHPDDALVAFGVGNWLRFNKVVPSGGFSAWHLAGIQIQSMNPNTPSSEAHFDTLPNLDDTRLAIVDADRDNTQGDLGYKYTLQIYDEALDRVIDYDPKIINRAPAVTN